MGSKWVWGYYFWLIILLINVGCIFLGVWMWLRNWVYDKVFVIKMLRVFVFYGMVFYEMLCLDLSLVFILGSINLIYCLVSGLWERNLGVLGCIGWGL